MDEILQQQILEAEAAAAQVAEQEELRRKAGQLEQLRETARRQREAAELRAPLAGELAALPPTVETLATEVEAWNAAFAGWVSQGAALLARLADLQARIYAAGQRARWLTRPPAPTRSRRLSGTAR